MEAESSPRGAVNRPLRVILADDDPLVRRALRAAFVELGIDVVAEAADGQQAVEATRREQPDVILMDVEMPVVDGVTATLRIRRLMPNARVLMLTSSVDPRLGFLGLRAGAAGFLTKDVGVEALGRAVRGVAQGEAALSREFTLGLVERLRRLPDYSDGLRPVRSQLTTREWQVLDLMCAESSTDDMARELVLSIATVRSHVKHILHKLGAHSREEAVQVAGRLREGSPVGEGSSDQLTEAAFRRTFERLRAQAEER